MTDSTHDARSGGHDTPLLRLRDLVVDYRRAGRRGGRLTAVKGVNLTVRRGHTVGLVGESGSGKSSTGLAVLGLVPATGGTIEFDGVDITHGSRADRRLLARRMQVVFQDPYGSMNPARTIGDTLGEALRHNLGLKTDAIGDRVRHALHDVGLPSDTVDRYPAEFSGGQRQRIAIARALVMDPEFIVCDEAVSALDLSVQAQVLNLLARLKAHRRLSYLFISHDLAVVRHLSDEIAVLYAGRIVEFGPAARVTELPAHPYTRALLAAAPVSDPAEQARRRADRLRSVSGVGVGVGVVDVDDATNGCAFAPRCPFAAPICRSSRPELVEHDGVRVACHRTGDVVASAPSPLPEASAASAD